MYILILFTDSSRINNLLFRIFFTEFLQILEKARKEGFVSIKWTNFSMFGASGVGKTSLLNLLLRKKTSSGSLQHYCCQISCRMFSE